MARPLNRPATQEEQTVDRKAGDIFDLGDFREGFGATRTPNIEPDNEGWITPPVKEDSPFETGQVRIRTNTSFKGGFHIGNDTRADIQVKRDGQWEDARSDQEAQQIMNSLIPKNQGEEEPRQQQQAESQDSQESTRYQDMEPTDFSPSRNWSEPEAADDAPFKTGEVRIKTTMGPPAAGGFDPGKGVRWDIQVKRDGNWVDVEDEEEARRIWNGLRPANRNGVQD